MIRALFTGSFDPPTLGHLEIISRVVNIVDELIVGVARSDVKGAGILSPQECHDLLTEETKQWNNVLIDLIPGLVVEYTKQNNITFIIRGIRSESDVSHEREMAYANQKLTGIETLLIFGQQHTSLSSSLIRELARKKAPLKDFLSPLVEKTFQNKLQQQRS